MRKLTWTLAGFIVIIALSLFWTWWKSVWFIPIEVVSLSDKLQYADPDLVKAAVSDEVKHGFFGVNLSHMRDNLLSVPWVANAKVMREWPNAVRISIIERQPLARFANNGVIDTTGLLFNPPLTINAKLKVSELPEFVGSESDVNSMVAMYLMLLAKIKPLGLTVKRLVIMTDKGWQAMLDNGLTIILGQNEIEERVTRFVLAYNEEKAGLRNANTRIVDLRYTNGMAVSG